MQCVIKVHGSDVSSNPYSGNANSSDQFMHYQVDKNNSA
jgi:hypothetical protein